MAFVYEMTRPGKPPVLYGYGPTRGEAYTDARRQVAGKDRLIAISILNRLCCVEIDDDKASEIEEMISADVIEWLDT